MNQYAWSADAQSIVMDSREVELEVARIADEFIHDGSAIEAMIVG